MGKDRYFVIRSLLIGMFFACFVSMILLLDSKDKESENLQDTLNAPTAIYFTPMVTNTIKPKETLTTVPSATQDVLGSEVNGMVQCPKELGWPSWEYCTATPEILKQ